MKFYKKWPNLTTVLFWQDSPNGEYDHKASSWSICPGSFFPFSYRGFLKESITTQLKMVLLSMGWDLRDIKKINWGSKFTWHLNEEFSNLASGSGHDNQRPTFLQSPSMVIACKPLLCSRLKKWLNFVNIIET